MSLRPVSHVGFQKRLREIAMFFEKKSPVHKTMRRLAKRLEKAGIAYAVMGGMAVNAHGAERTTRDVDILLKPEGLELFRKKHVGRSYQQVGGRPRRFKENRSGVTIDVLVTGKYPGSGKPGPIGFPDPTDVRTTIDDIEVVALPELIELKLAARRYYDFGDVVSLIRANNLNESFAERLHESVRQDYIECLEEKRREDEYEARAEEE